MKTFKRSRWGLMEQLSTYVRDKQLQKHIMTADDAADFIHDGMTIGLSGFTRAGDAKAVPHALINRARKRPFKINVFTGASLGSDIDAKMAEAGIVNRRMPFQADRTMRDKINAGEILFVDSHLSHMAENIRRSELELIDVAVIEALAITADGYIIPTTSVGNSSLFVDQAKQIIVEINLAQPAALEGIHDIYDVGSQGKDRQPILMQDVSDRIGEPGIKVDPQKIVGIVLTNEPDSPSTVLPPDAETEQMAAHLIDFLKGEVQAGRLTNQLAPLQSGIGTVANAVMYGLLETDFTDLQVYSEVLQDAVLDLIDAGKVSFASGCSMTLSAEKMSEVFSDLGNYKDRLVLRPQEISNHPEIIRRLGLISINTALEVDIYGNVNSTHVLGTKMMNGIGGSGDFARNARLAIFVTKSIAKNGDISSIVPFVSHVDHTEHDVDVIVTEQGYADLRGLAPVERAEKIINDCVHPSYRDQLLDYYKGALRIGGHTPHDLSKAFSWHEHYATYGTMQQRVLQKV